MDGPTTVGGCDEPYTLDAELTFSGDDLFFTPTLTECSSFAFELEVTSAVGGASEVVYISVTGSSFEAVADALAADETVDSWSLVASFDRRWLVRVRPSPTVARLSEHLGWVGGYVREVRGRVGGWTVRLFLPDRTALTDLIDRCRAEGTSVSVSHLSNIASTSELYPETLTDEQRKLLVAASRDGYFEVPRRISQRELADRFDVSPSAISQRLRTAIGALVASTYGT